MVSFTNENVLVLLILGGALVLFISEKLRVDVVALLVLCILILTNLITPDEAFTGFSSPAVMTVLSIFIISGGLARSGIADALGRGILRLAGDNPIRLTVVIMLTVGIMSAFMNNIGAVAILLPAVLSVSRQVDIPPSKLLIPLSFASLMGGNMTLVGTPPNILASSILRDYSGLEPFAFFDFLPMGMLVLVTGIVYMVVVGRHILPARYSASAPNQSYQLRSYLSEVRISDQSGLVGQTLVEARLGEQYDLSVIHVQRGGENPSFFTHRDRPLRAGDILLIEGKRDALLNAGNVYHLIPTAGASEKLDKELTPHRMNLVEVTLAPNTGLDGQTLKEIDFRARFGLSVLAIRQQGASLVSNLGDVILRFGDALLVQGEQDRIDLLRQDSDFLLLDTPPIQMHRLRKAPLAVGIVVVVLLVITLGWLEPAPAMLMGALAMVLSGTLNMDEAYQSIEWKAIFLIAGILPIGIAMEKTGTARLIAEYIVGLMGGLGAYAVLLGIFVMTALLTEVISNAAATVLVVPIAIDIALGLNANPYAFVMAVVIAASTSFLMPIGHQANVIVFGPGGYQFSDYTRVGVWLNLLILLVVTLFLPVFWPLFP